MMMMRVFFLVAVVWRFVFSYSELSSAVGREGKRSERVTDCFLHGLFLGYYWVSIESNLFSESAFDVLGRQG